MTDITENPQSPMPAGNSADRTKAGSVFRRARRKARFAAETRFKLIGLSAVLVSGVFLVLLLSTIVGQALPAFTYYYLKLPADLTRVEQQDIAGGDFNGAIRDALADATPYMSSRTDKRLVRSLVSSGAGIELQREAIDNPQIVGKQTDVMVPVSDFADLYLKGLTAKSLVETPQSPLSITGNTDVISLSTPTPEFSRFIDLVKKQLSAEAAKLQTRLSSISILLDQQRDIISNSDNEQAVADARKALQSLEGQFETLTGRYNAIIERRDDSEGVIALDENMPSVLIRANGGVFKVNQISNSTARANVIVPPRNNDDVASGAWSVKKIFEAEANRKLSDKEIIIMDQFAENGQLERQWNSIFFQKGASREPEMAGIWGAVVGSFFTMIVTLMLSFPLGVAAAIYLEEFAPKNRLTDLIEVNINNLAAVPSIVFGLLGLAMFLNFFGLPRSAPLVGGMVLALMTLPTIIIASRAALKAVPPSIREAALGVGASKLQTVFHHVLPLAMPGILTGTIIGMAQALGETAPLLMIGMVAFVVDVPGGFTDPATVLPVQIFMWADFPEPGFQQKTAAAILILLGFLVLMNAIAVLLRKRFERRW